MNIKILFPLSLAMMYGQAFAADGKITIASPADNTVVNAKAKVMVEYEAMLGPNGDHLHLYVDGKRIDVLRQLKGKAELDALPTGKHKVCLAENTKAHVVTGVETCVNLTSQ